MIEAHPSCGRAEGGKEIGFGIGAGDMGHKIFGKN